MTTRRATSRRAFTLLEVLIVTVLMGIIAVSAVPALQQNTSASIGAASDEVARLLAFARSRAIASGRPVGVSFDTNTSVVQVWMIDDAGDAQAYVDPVTLRVKSAVISDLFEGASVSSFTNGDGTTSTGTVWFDYTGTPHTRDVDSGFGAFFSENAIVTVSASRIVELHAYTGMIEQR